MKKYNVGVVGYGWVASAHISAIYASTMLEAQLRRIELPGGADCGALPKRGRVNRRNVGTSDTTVSNNTDVIFLHGPSANLGCRVTSEGMPQSLTAEVKTI